MISMAQLNRLIKAYKASKLTDGEETPVSLGLEVDKGRSGCYMSRGEAEETIDNEEE